MLENYRFRPGIFDTLSAGETFTRYTTCPSKHNEDPEKVGVKIRRLYDLSLLMFQPSYERGI